MAPYRRRRIGGVDACHIEHLAHRLHCFIDGDGNHPIGIGCSQEVQHLVALHLVVALAERDGARPFGGCDGCGNNTGEPRDDNGEDNEDGKDRPWATLRPTR